MSLTKEQKELSKSTARAELSLKVIQTLNKFKSSEDIELSEDDKLFVLSDILNRRLKQKT